MNASFFAAAALFAAAPNLPVYEPGQTFVYDDGRVERVVEVDGSKVVWATRGGREYERAANPVVPILKWSFRGVEGDRAIVGDPDKLWPLEPGRSSRFRSVATLEEKDRRTRRVPHHWNCSVRKPDMTQTPAGRFATYPIVCERFSHTSMKLVERVTWRYAPAVGHYVQREIRDMRNGDVETISLHSALPPRKANAVKIEALVRDALAGG